MKYSYAIFADSGCELTAELRNRFEVDGYLKGYISTPDADNIETSLDLNEAELDKFFASVKQHKNGFKTSPPSIEEIVLYFESFLKQGKDVLALSMSNAMSATYNLMLKAKEIVCKKYPDRKVFVIDTLRVSASVGLLTAKACALRAEGLSIEKNAEKIESIKKTVHQMGTLDDLFWLASKGRVSGAKAFFGTLAGIKSLGDYGPDGMSVPIAKVSGYKKAQAATVEYIKRTIKSANEQIIFVAHSARREQAEILAALIKENIKPKEVIICGVQQISGINIGPGLFAAYYFGTEITDLKNEKEIINNIIESKL